MVPLSSLALFSADFILHSVFSIIFKADIPASQTSFSESLAEESLITVAKECRAGAGQACGMHQSLGQSWSQPIRTT